MFNKIKMAWKQRNNVAMGFLMIVSVYTAFVVNNLKHNNQRPENEKQI